MINLDFADVKTIMSGMGFAIMGTGTGEGETRAPDAAQRAISSPLLEDASVKGARGVIINITGGPDFSLAEVNDAATIIQEAAHEDANIIFGAVIDPTMHGRVKITVIATGFDRPDAQVGAAGEPDAGRPAALHRVAAGGAAAPRPAAAGRASRSRGARWSSCRRPPVSRPRAAWAAIGRAAGRRAGSSRRRRSTCRRSCAGRTADPARAAQRALARRTRSAGRSRLRSRDRVGTLRRSTGPARGAV